MELATSRAMSPEQRVAKFESLLTPGSKVENQHFDLPSCVLGISRVAAGDSVYSVTISPRSDRIPGESYDYDRNGNVTTAHRDSGMGPSLGISEPTSPDALIGRANAVNRRSSTVSR